MEPGAFVNQTDDVGYRPSSDATTLVAAQLMISGLVQGVWYRASLQQKAQQLELNGWCRNRQDGSVEAFVQGPEDVIKQLVHWAHQGPPNARVERVDVSPQPQDASLMTQTEFEVRPTC